jgi:hypothetical protein
MPKKTIKVRKWRIGVYQDHVNNSCEYTVHAVNELDARIIAFALDGGFPKAMTEMRDGDIELVVTYTAVLKST